MFREIPTPPDVCPACERYIAEASVCPYCTADTKQGPRLHRFRMLAFVMMAIGAAGMLLLNDPAPPGFTPIGSIDLQTAQRYVRITGRVLRPPYMVERNGLITYLSFVLEDETGHIRVQVDDQVAQSLQAADELPWEGSVLNAEGPLKLAPDGKIKMRVAHLKQIEFLTRKMLE